MRREAAIARLRVVGPRALGRLATLLESDADAAAKSAALQALEGVGDPRTIELAMAALADPEPDVAIAAVGVLRGWVTHEQGTRVLEALSSRALDRTLPAAVRLASLDALAELPRHILQPLMEQIPPDPASAVDDPAKAAEWIEAHGRSAAFSELHAIVSRVREQERAEPSARRRDDWLRTRGAVHSVLARRGSRVALYDLRETFDAAASPLPLDFLTAMTLIGDVSCLEPMARAWAAAPAEQWWRDRLADAAAEIMTRARLSGRSAAVKRIRSKWAGFL